MAKPLPITFAREMPSVWRADELARPVDAVVATGHAALDAQLPAGGWPVGALVEVLQGKNNLNEWRLLLPALARCSGPVLLVGAPHQPFGPGLAAQGLDPQRLLCVTAQTTAQRLWACEQALRCADVTAVLAWVPQVRPEQLRRLQMAASTHSKLLFVMRPLAAREESSPAALRVLVSGQGSGQGSGQEGLALHILKRRGPPLAQPLSLPARAARLAALLAVTRRQGAAPPIISAKDGDEELHEASHHAVVARITPFPGHGHALDRTAAAA
ncbi:MAG: translesion DNA synthesis-associated protein ImuA [Rhodoferax sp.]|nr:translesion DNA synthesis-associated protein ImuA [Rhodoferax sp.]